MRNPFRRTWEVVRYDKRTFREIPPEPPEQPHRLFMRQRSAVTEAMRLNYGATAINARWRFRVSRRYQ